MDRIFLNPAMENIWLWAPWGEAGVWMSPSSGPVTWGDSSALEKTTHPVLHRTWEEIKMSAYPKMCFWDLWLHMWEVAEQKVSCFLLAWCQLWFLTSWKPLTFYKCLSLISNCAMFQLHGGGAVTWDSSLCLIHLGVPQIWTFHQKAHVLPPCVPPLASCILGRAGGNQRLCISLSAHSN